MCLGEHHDVGFDVFECEPRSFPEIRRHLTGNVATESVEIKLSQPVFQHVSHVATQFLVVVVERGDVVPVIRISDVALRVVFVKLGMLHQHAVPRRVIRDDVDDHFQPARVCFANESLEIVGRAVIAIDRVVIAHGVRTADRSLLLFVTDRMNRHQPENRDPEIFEFIKPRRDRVEVSLLRKRSRIDLVNDTITHPIGHGPLRSKI